MPRFATRLRTVLDRFVTGARWALGGLLLAMVALNVGNAVGRYVFLRSIEGADEILVFALIWVVFVGAALVTWEGGHLSLDLLDRALPAPARRWLARLQLATVALLAGFVTVQSVDFVERIGSLGQLSMGAQVPMVIPHLALPVGFGLVAAFALARLALGVLDARPSQGAG